MSRTKNILFIMFDQLRWDYLSCYGHPHLETPNIDRLASMGVRFNNAYIQSPLCGPSRMSTYTGRYVHSHGASWNNVPLKVGEMTLGDHLRNSGMDCWLVGKTHMVADIEGLDRLGIDPNSKIGARLSECGFDVFERDDGMRPEGPDGYYDPRGALNYNEYLRSKGYESQNPWHDYANSANDHNGNVLSGWFLENANKPANISEEDSETPYMTRRGMEFIESQGDKPWLCHLSYIKPHWPYIAPAPYNDMYGPEHFLPPVRDDDERENGHPIFQAMMQALPSKAFSRDEVRDTVLSAYMGLIKQIDDQMGVLFQWLEDTGRFKETMIVLTSDHGDYLGDHWMGEKTFFHNASVKIPLIIYDPSSEADKTRGTVCEELVECIDFAPTFVDAAGGDAKALDHVLEGKSLMPILHGKQDGPFREYAFCEYDYSSTPLSKAINLNSRDARTFMVTDGEWKLIYFGDAFRPMLFSLKDDPNELRDLAADGSYADTIERLMKALRYWAMRPGARTTISNQKIDTLGTTVGRTGIVLGTFHEDDVDEQLTQCYRGRHAPSWKETVKTDA